MCCTPIRAVANDFHNLGGGYVVLGVEERNGLPRLPPKGIDPERIDAVQKELLQLGQSAIQPRYHPITATYNVEGRTILVLWVPGGENPPLQGQSRSDERATAAMGIFHTQAQ